MISQPEVMPAHLWRWHEELRDLTSRAVHSLPVIPAPQMPPEADMSELIILDFTTQVEFRGHALNVTELIALWPGDFGWYRVTGLPLGNAAFSNWPVHE